MYPDEFYEYGDMGEGMFAIVIGVYMIALVLMLIFSVVSYVLQSVGLHAIAKRRGIHHAWLGWLPVGNVWVMGSISDQYQYVAKGKIRNRRKVLLGLTAAMYIPLIFLYIWGIANMLSAAVMMPDDGYGMAAGSGIALLLILLAVYMVIIAVAITAAVFQYIACYDLFCSCNPNTSVAFLVLSIIFSFLLPIFIFACRNKDLGMPPRKPRIPAPPVWQMPVQPVAAEPETPAPESAAEPEE